MGVDLYNNEREYFAAFISHTDQKEKIAERIREGFPTHAPTVAQAIADGQQVDFLDVGSGAGHTFLPFVKNLDQRSISYFYDELNIGMELLFFFNYLGHGLHLGALERYDKRDGLAFVNVSHSLYYYPDWECKVQEIYDSLAPGGVACITLTSEESPLYTFRSKFFPQVGHPLPRTAEQLEGILEKLSIPSTSESIVSSLGVDPILEDQHYGREILTFLLRNRPTPEIAEQARQDLAALSTTAHAPLEVSMWSESFSWVHRTLHYQLPLMDKVIWLEKPGKYHAPEALPSEKKEMTLGEFKQFFKKSLDAYLGDDINFMSTGIKNAYVSLLLADAVMRTPLYLTFVYDDRNEISGPDPLNYEVDYTRLLHPDDVVLICEMPHWGGFKEMAEGNYAIIGWIGMGPTLDWALDLLQMTYHFLPQEDIRQIGGFKQYARLMFNMFRNFEHFKALGMDQRSVYENMSYGWLWNFQLTLEQRAQVTTSNEALKAMIFNDSIDQKVAFTRVPQPFPIVT